MSEFINTTIGECCEILDSFRIPLNEEERNKIPGNIPYYGANGVQGYIDKYIFDEDLILIAEDGGNFESYETRPIAYRISGKSWVNNHAHILRALKRYNQDYIFYSLVNKNILNYIVGGTRSKLNQRELKTITISIPKQKSEQTAIAHILSTVDKAFEQTEKLIAKYKRIKTGLMQDLLTKGIDENENIRSEKTHKFKDSPLGRIPFEWEVKTVKEFANITTGSNDTQDKVENGLYPFYVRSQQVERINAFSFNGEGVLTSGDGVGVGKIYHYANGKFSFHQRVYLMHSFSDFILGKYFYIYFSNHFENEIMKYSAKTTVDSVRLHMIADMLIPIPTIAEQKVIVNNIMEVENFIQIETESLIKFQKIKSGLMQDLLTGKVRVPEELIEEINNEVNLNN